MSKTTVKAKDSKKASRRKPATARETLALFDGDVIVYALVTQHIVEEHNDDDEWWTTVDVKQVMEEVQTRVQVIMAECRAKEAVFAFGSPNNFRKRLNPEYKAHRIKRKPLGYWATIEKCRALWSNTTIDNLEADDVIGLMVTQPGDYDIVVVSNDKDMRSLPCKIYNPDTFHLDQKFIEVDEHEAMVNLLTQTLTGDTADGYKGCPGVGAVKAEKILQGMRANIGAGATPEEALRSGWTDVVAAYEAAGLSAGDALMNYRMARILRHGDYDAKSGKVKLHDPRK